MNRHCAFNTKAKRFRRTQQFPYYYLRILGSREDLDEPFCDGDGASISDAHPVMQLTRDVIRSVIASSLCKLG